MRSLTDLRRLRTAAQWGKRTYYTRFWGMDIHDTVLFSMSANFDRTYPKGVHIGPETYVAFGAVVLTHDRTRGLYLDTRIGRHCFIGAHSMVLPGVTIGDGCVVGAGSVVTRDVPDRTIVAGNPARVIRSGVEVGPYGRYVDADERTRRDREARALREAGPGGSSTG